MKIHFRLFVIFFLTLAPIARSQTNVAPTAPKTAPTVPNSKPGDPKATVPWETSLEAAKALLPQYEALQSQLLKERQQALAKAHKATADERNKIMSDLENSQKDRQAQLQVLAVQVFAAEKQKREDARSKLVAVKG